tara:strand:+ start:716 stop:994 length:279 start_codon:yes stop_codon:yes gene_type:complete
MKEIKRRDILNLLKENKNEVFSVVFLKKNGELRPMNCRFGVKKHLKGGKLAFNPLERSMLVVFDMQKKGYRMINLETLMTINMKGVEYYVSD